MARWATAGATGTVTVAATDGTEPVAGACGSVATGAVIGAWDPGVGVMLTQVASLETVPLPLSLPWATPVGTGKLPLLVPVAEAAYPAAEAARGSGFTPCVGDAPTATAKGTRMAGGCGDPSSAGRPELAVKSMPALDDNAQGATHTATQRRTRQRRRQHHTHGTCFVCAHGGRTARVN